jgi:DNA-directed RNA polymerase specialized sigma subunit
MTSSSHPRSVPHEICANILYAEHGDGPYWAARNIFQAFPDDETISTQIENETWTVSISSQQSGLDPRPSDDIESLKEYRVSCTGADEQKLPLLIQPRLDWPASCRPKSVPKDLGLATNIRVDTATYLEPSSIESLIPEVLKSLAEYANIEWDDSFLTEAPHQYSSIMQYERYYRIDRQESQSLVSDNGIFHRLFRLAANSEGSKILHSEDNTQIVGYNHQLRLNRSGANKLFDSPQHGKQFKHYHPKHVRKNGSNDPLYHPKVGCLFKKSWSGNESVRWSEHQSLTRELEENLINLLHWADIPISSEHCFISDWHFDCSPSDRDITIVEDPTPEIDHHQDTILISALSNLSERDRNILKAVANAPKTGTHISNIEAETGLSNSAVYRGLNELNKLLRNEGGTVQFVSRKIRQRIHELFEVSNSTSPEDEIITSTLDIDPDELEQNGDPWQQWLVDYGAEINKQGSDMIIRIHTTMDQLKCSNCEYAPDVIERGGEAWVNSGRPSKQFQQAEVVYDTKNGTESVSVKSQLSFVFT